MHLTSAALHVVVVIELGRDMKTKQVVEKEREIRNLDDVPQLLTSEELT